MTIPNENHALFQMRWPCPKWRLDFRAADGDYPVTMNQLQPIVRFLDHTLAVSFADGSNNGLQVENSGRVRRICTGVDASLPFFERAAARGADLVICHHGLSWGDNLKYLTGLNYRRVGFLMRHDMALYASHLPLDAHPKHGNNACVARALGLRRVQPWGDYKGGKVGLRGVLPAPLSLDAFAKRVERIVGNKPQVIAYGKKTVRTVAMVVGGGAVGLDHAAADGIDVYLSGEPGLNAHNLAQETKTNAVFAGHYATESLGVQALGALLRRRFRLPVEHLDLGIPY
jgi:dinuclear metal center YbgI/SA1388 family protein